MRAMPRRSVPRGFTLIELLVVVAIIGLISAAALPVVLPALNERRVSEAARILQAVLSGTRDAAIRANAPRGIRLLPDPVFDFLDNIKNGQPLASNRFVPIEPAPDYNEGEIRNPTSGTISIGGTNVADPSYDTTSPQLYLRIAESGYGTSGLNAPTGWKFNVRQGDKIRFNNSGNYYTIAGPINGFTGGQTSVTSFPNPERYICYPAVYTSTQPNHLTTGWLPEFLNLTNGVDDDGDGWIDESCDGIDNDGDGIVDPGFNGLDDNGDGNVDEPLEMHMGIGTDANGNRITNAGSEYEQEAFLGVESNTNVNNQPYTIIRRPVVSPGAAETTLPAGVVIDLTTWNAAASTAAIAIQDNTTPLLPERSRLPVDPFSGYVDIMIDQSGRVIPPGAGSGGGDFYANSPLASVPFYHFWIAEREDVRAPLWGTQASPSNFLLASNPNFGTGATAQNYFLPMPKGTNNPTIASGNLAAGNYYDPMPAPYNPGSVYLQGERRLVTLFTKTGQIVTNSIETFNVNDTSYPYYAAQAGTKEQQ